MKTEILDNYIEATTGAINWVMLWIEHQVTPHVLKWHGITKGEELEQRLSELSTKSIEAEIYENSTPTDLRDYALVFCNKLNDKGALFKFEFEDRSFNYEREYIECIDNLLEKKEITEDEAKAIASCIDNIVIYVYQNSEELIKIFKGFGLKEKCKDSKNKHSILNGANTDASEQVERNIDEEALKQYFKSTFKGSGNNSINYFNYLIDDIKKVATAKDAARMALIIYKSDKIIETRKPDTFAEWYKLFCKMTVCTYNDEYKPNKLNTNEMKRKLYYL